MKANELLEQALDALNGCKSIAQVAGIKLDILAHLRDAAATAATTTGPAQVTVVAPLEPSFIKALGITEKRAKELTELICESMKVDLNLTGIPGRPKNPIARVLQRITADTTSINETALVLYLLNKALESQSDGIEVHVIKL